MAIWACLGSKCSQVRILLPGPGQFGISEFGFRICRASNFSSGPWPAKSQIRNPISEIDSGCSQVAKAADCRSVMHRFESDYPLQSDAWRMPTRLHSSFGRTLVRFEQEVAGSTPANVASFLVAILSISGECRCRLHGKSTCELSQEVVGSIPTVVRRSSVKTSLQFCRPAFGEGAMPRVFPEAQDSLT